MYNHYPFNLMHIIISFAKATQRFGGHSQCGFTSEFSLQNLAIRKSLVCNATIEPVNYYIKLCKKNAQYNSVKA